VVSDISGFEQVLDICLDRLNNGDPVGACLASYPAHAERLAPLLRVAQFLQTPDGPSMSAEGFDAAQVRMQARADGLRARRRSRPQPRRASVWPYLLAITRRLTIATAIGAFLLLMVLGAGAVTVSAASGSLPGSPLYPVKRATESFVSAVAYTPRLQARAHLKWADRRLHELEALFDRDRIVYRTVLVAVENETQRALVAAEQADPGTLMAVVTHIEHQQAVLGELLDQVSGSSRTELEWILVESAEANERARSALGEDLPITQTASPAPEVTSEPPGPDDTPQLTEFTPTPAPTNSAETPEASVPEAQPEPTEGLVTPQPTPTPRPSQSATAPQPTEPTQSPTPVSTATFTPTTTPVPEKHEPPTFTPTPEPSQPPPPTLASEPTQEPTLDVWDRSGLEFIDEGLTCEAGGTIWVKVVNQGNEAMAGPTDWELWFAASGPPKLGELIATGEVPALDAGQEYRISELPTEGSGRYIYMAYQRPGHPGENVLWSGAIVVDASQCIE
jgi:hypothetical protein